MQSENKTFFRIKYVITCHLTYGYLTLDDFEKPVYWPIKSSMLHGEKKNTHTLVAREKILSTWSIPNALI